MGLTKIEWTKYTFNPWWGCSKISPACGLPLRGRENEEHGECYAKTLAERYGWSTDGAHFPIWGQHADRRGFGDKHWEEPAKWNRAAAAAGTLDRVFCGSMCDIFEQKQAGAGQLDINEQRRRLWPLIASTPSLIWLLLTKRPHNVSRMVPGRWLNGGWPKNAWLGFTAETQEYFSLRWAYAKSTPAPLIFCSAEPRLGPLDISAAVSGPRRLGWLIDGGESGAGARPSCPDWFYSTRDQCEAAGIPYMFKQWGEWGPNVFAKRQVDMPAGDGTHYRMYRAGRHATGRILSGREWNEMPEVLR